MSVATRSSEALFGEAWEAFFRAARRVRARHSEGEGLTISQYQLLEPLTAGPGTVGALAEAAGVSPPTATRALDGLVKRGLVERHPSEEDRRCVLIALTDEGRREVEAKRRRVQATRRRLARVLDPAEREQATVLLRRLAEAMDEL